MARRYRYAFTKKKESPGGIASVICAGISLAAFGGAVLCACLLPGSPAWAVGGLCLLGALLSVYGFITGLASFSKREMSHTASIIGSMASGLIMILWLGLYLTGV